MPRPSKKVAAGVINRYGGVSQNAGELQKLEVVRFAASFHNRQICAGEGVAFEPAATEHEVESDVDAGHSVSAPSF